MNNFFSYIYKNCQRSRKGITCLTENLNSQQKTRSKNRQTRYRRRSKTRRASRLRKEVTRPNKYSK